MIKLSKILLEEIIMKKFLLFSLTALAAFLFTFSAFAADIAVKVDGRTITFREDPKPVVLSDRTYVPVRRVLERMGARVAWDGETRTVTVTSYDNIKMVVLTIDSPEIIVYTFTSVLHADKDTVISDVSPIILDDRTMLPIRVIAEALGADVEYDESGIAEITTNQAKTALKETFGEDALKDKIDLADAYSENLPKISLSCDAKDIKAGDEISVYVHISDLETSHSGASFSGLTTTVFYDTENFSYDGFTCIDKNGEAPPALSADNALFYENGAKIVYIYTPGSEYVQKEDGAVLKLTFTALSDKGGLFSLSDGVSELGYDNEVIFSSGDNAYSIARYDELFVDTSELSVR